MKPIVGQGCTVWPMITPPGLSTSLSLSLRLFLLLPAWGWGGGQRGNGTCESKLTGLVLVFLTAAAQCSSSHRPPWWVLRKLHRRESSICASLVQVMFFMLMLLGSPSGPAPGGPLPPPSGRTGPLQAVFLPAIGGCVPAPIRGSSHSQWGPADVFRCEG